MDDREIAIGDLDASIRWIEDIPCHQFPGWLNVTTSMRKALKLLKEQSEIVLCKDCKYGEHMCKPWSDIICNQNRATHIPDWFCADGKRKEI